MDVLKLTTAERLSLLQDLLAEMVWTDEMELQAQLAYLDLTVLMVQLVKMARMVQTAQQAATGSTASMAGTAQHVLYPERSADHSLPVPTEQVWYYSTESLDQPEPKEATESWDLQDRQVLQARKAVRDKMERMAQMALLVQSGLLDRSALPELLALQDTTDLMRRLRLTQSLK